MKKSSTLWKVLIAIVLAFVIGQLVGTESSIFGITFYRIFDIGGQLFLNSLTLLVVPLIASAIISGLGQMGGDKSFGKLGAKTFGFYVATILIAVLVGVLAVNVIKPGALHHFSLPSSAPELASATTAIEAHFSPTNPVEAIAMLLQKLVPMNIVEAASQGNMLGIIFFSLLFGFALMKITGQFGESVVLVSRGLFYTLMRMTHFIMKAMPLGVFCLVAKVIATQGIASVGGLIHFFLTVLCALVVFCFGALPLLLKIMGVNPWRHIRALAPALITAFSTSSSAATLPITLDCVEKRAGVSNRVSSFVIPLGTSMNMAGSALYECVAALFIAQAYGIDLTIGHQILIVLLALITSMGVAAIPSASLVALIIILNVMGIPKEGIALILPVDRLLDMCRTTANVLSDASCAVMVARTEGETVLTSKRLK